MKEHRMIVLSRNGWIWNRIWLDADISHRNFLFKSRFSSKPNDFVSFIILLPIIVIAVAHWYYRCFVFGCSVVHCYWNKQAYSLFRRYYIWHLFIIMHMFNKFVFFISSGFQPILHNVKVWFWSRVTISK